MSETTLRPFGHTGYLLGNGSDTEFILNLEGLVKLKSQIDTVLKAKGLM